jgi:hypothetical protein
MDEMMICPNHDDKSCLGICKHKRPHPHGILCDDEIGRCMKCVSLNCLTVQGEDHLLGATNGRR